MPFIIDSAPNFTRYPCYNRPAFGGFLNAPGNTAHSTESRTMTKTTKNTVTKNQNSTVTTTKDSTVNNTVNIQDYVSITAVSIKKATNGYTLNELDYVTGKAKGFRLRPTTIQNDKGRKLNRLESTTQVAEVKRSTTIFQASVILDGPDAGKVFWAYYGKNSTVKIGTESTPATDFTHEGRMTIAEAQEFCDAKYAEYCAAKEKAGEEPAAVSPVGEYCLELLPGAGLAGFCAGQFGWASVQKKATQGGSGKVAKLEAEIAQKEKAMKERDNKIAELEEKMKALIDMMEAKQTA